MYELANICVHSDGLIALHNMPCACCLKNHAVYQCQDGNFQPCWSCQGEGWKIVKEKPKRSLWYRIFVGGTP